MLEPSLELYGATYDRVDAVLGDLLTRCHGRYAMIVDLKGFVLVHARSLWAPKPPSLDSLATLVASNYSANLAIAKLFGEGGFKEMVQQGEDVGMFVDELGDKALLVTIFDDSAVLGRVKLFTKKASEDILRLISENTDTPPKLELGEGWQTSNQALLDGLFGTKS
jgi:predicted regulator of Ras-like GTPase activity (Roadblock/LC7/MglB family)